ncbi:putative WRKY transcription factor 14 [Acorus gramineus]|uniref:WRKY transcription factor 14 n=1 Tax=Acorus gramineus TaxID=55184 RepID=A0AAV9BQX1_ACOGR|nr:putative WRKY transcription factor 14 [Acorus gramineus]
MCSYFLKRMENDQGDLADVVRASGGGFVVSPNHHPIFDWQFPSEPDLPIEDFNSDTFSNLRDPLLHELNIAGSGAMFDGPDSLGGGFGNRNADCDDGGLQKMMLGEEMKRPCNIFSRMLQISPTNGKADSMCSSSNSPLPSMGVAISTPRGIKSSALIGNVSIEAGGMQISSPRSMGIKRRKSQAKKVVCIPAPAAATSRPSGEVVPSDLWAWRKYGQKPIKGSPYPRGYYRCSSSKGCSARKQVERSRTDPNMLVITYTSEHNHPWPMQRNALAGSTRSQPSKNNNNTASKVASPSTQRPRSIKEEQKAGTAPPEDTPSTTISNNSAPVKEEIGELERPIDVASVEEFEFEQEYCQGSYKPMVPDPKSSADDDFFGDLVELETDPLNLIFSKGFTTGEERENRNNNKSMDPFNMFDWGGNSFGETRRGL